MPPGDDNGRLMRLLEQVDKKMDKCDAKVDNLTEITGEIRIEQRGVQEQVKTLFAADQRHEKQIDKATKLAEKKLDSGMSTKSLVGLMLGGIALVTAVCELIRFMMG